MNQLSVTWCIMGEMATEPIAGVAICGALVGALSMLLYARLSPQARVAQLSAQIAQARSALNQAGDCDMRTVWSMTMHALGLSIQQIRLILVPTLCAAMLVLGVAWFVDLMFDLSHICIMPARQPSWLFSGHTAFWVPLTVVAVAVKWKFAIK